MEVIVVGIYLALYPLPCATLYDARARAPYTINLLIYFTIQGGCCLKLAKYRSCYCNLCRYGHSHEGWPKIEARESRHMTERYVFRRYLSAADVSSSLNYFGPFGVS